MVQKHVLSQDYTQRRKERIEYSLQLLKTQPGHGGVIEILQSNEYLAITVSLAQLIHDLVLHCMRKKILLRRYPMHRKLYTTLLVVKNCIKIYCQTSGAEIFDII